MCFQYHRRALAVAIVALSVPLCANAQPPGDEQTAPWSQAPPRDGFSLRTAPTLSDVLSGDAFRPLRIGEDMPLGGRSASPLTRESLEQQLRQRMQSRIRQLPDEIGKLRGNPWSGDVVDLPHQRSSWFALVAGKYQKAAADLHDALLRGRPATVEEMHRIAGSEEDYQSGFGELSEAAAADPAGKAKQFLLTYHAALRGEQPLARAALERIEQQAVPIKLDPIVRFRLRQLVE